MKTNITYYFINNFTVYLNLTSNRYLKYILLFFFVNVFGIYYGQSVSSLELKLRDLNSRLVLESDKLDSLQTVYAERTKEIDSQKKKKDADQNTIKKLMAASVGLSNKIDDHQKKVTSLENEVEKIKVGLEKKYSVILDSLTELKNSESYAGNKDDLEKEILLVTEKKILISPKINILSYNPEKVISLNVSNAKSNEEKKIFREYLEEALKETELKLHQVQNLNSEVKQIVLLQKKTKKFLEDVEFSSAFGRSALALSSKTGSRETTTPGYTNGIGDGQEVFQVSTYLYLLDQLDYKMETNIKNKESFMFNSKNKNLSLREYSELLAEVEKRLSDYRLVLKNKISAFK
ncbi:MAG: hypothetical protein AB1521_07305 [Bacteroidota bacterium]